MRKKTPCLSAVNDLFCKIIIKESLVLFCFDDLLPFSKAFVGIHLCFFVFSRLLQPMPSFFVFVWGRLSFSFVLDVFCFQRFVC